MKNLFLKARPIWAKDKEQESNCRLQFKAVVAGGKQAELRLATSGVYQARINGKFVAYGPARAGKNHFRVERLDVSSYLDSPLNTVIIEVAGYYCANFYIMKQDSFLQAELILDGEVAAATGYDFSARVNPYYYQKIQRFSYQRTFAESYKPMDPADTFYTDDRAGEEELAVTADKTIIERTVPYPQFEHLAPTALFSGRVEHIIPDEYNFDRYFWQVGFREGEPTGWKANEIETSPEKEWQEMSFIPTEDAPSSLLKADTYTMYSFPFNATGMLSLTLTCKEPATVYLAGDEIIDGKKINPKRVRCCNIVPFRLKAGRHHIQTFEVYTMKYLQVTAVGADLEIEDISMIEYKAPYIPVPQFSDERLQAISAAAVESYRQNAVDLFTDCPSRERAGWLCDSFFLARAEYILTGKNIVEEAFLENFLHEEVYGKVPVGMFPMCYPADHNYGRHIPNWAMWLVVELLDYKKRTGKTQLIDRFKDKVYGLIKHFEDFENEDGLLEDLRSWVFVEWSRANDADMVQGVNYPSNMMYYATLKAAAELYGDANLEVKAENIKEKILEQSFDGEFFVDRGARTSIGVFPVPESTEVCQYYAFFSGVATPESHPDLFKTLINDFGPHRDLTTTYPQVHKAAPFIGNYMRLDILKNNGYDDVVEENIKGYFYGMARRTGTLWEKAEPTNSCNHGFASCVLYWLA